MEKLLAELIIKAYENDLDVEYSPYIGLLKVNKITFSDDGKITENISVDSGYIKDWKHELPTEVLRRINKSVDRFIKKEGEIEDAVK